MDGDQFIPSPPTPPPEQPERQATGFRKVAATALLSVGLLAGSGIGGYAIVHAAGNSNTAASSTAATTTAATPTPAATPTCPNRGTSTGTTG